MQTGELLTLSSSSSSSSSSTATMNQMEKDLESLALEDKLQVEDNSDEEFSFVCANPDGSPISADDAFFNGQIRPIYPLFNRDLLFAESSDDFENPPSLRSPLRKVFVEKPNTLAPESESETELEEGTYCEWSPATAELVKKSNSTGFSKLRRFRDFMTMNRSSSDGKDAFVFLSNSNSNPNPNPNKPHKLQIQSDTKNTTTAATVTATAAPKVNRVKVKGQTASTSSSAHETHYIRSRAQKQVNNRKSYLPYRQDLLGFFATANGFTKNVHPF